MSASFTLIVWRLDLPDLRGAIAGAVERFRSDRWLAHRILFAHRHESESAAAHRDLVEAINGRAARLSIEGFRGFGKTTYLEETAILRALFAEYHNLLIVGPSYDRACDRVGAIKNELLMNEAIVDFFGPQQGPIWQDGKIVLKNGVCIQALGRDQSMTGIKYLQWRPDAALIDDVEDPEESRTDSEREQTWTWLLRTFIPSLADPLGTWLRSLGTRRGSGSLPERMEKAGWRTVKYPIEHFGEDGARRATWPAKFPLGKVDAMKADYHGDMHLWAQEYMCESFSASDRVFTREMLASAVRPRTKTFEACYAMVDPARTVGVRSATTGWAVWSWVKSRLIVWAADGQLLLPDEIISLFFEIFERFGCVWIGGEEDGLSEWLRQPLRHEAVRRGVMLPVRALRAPRGKTQFISSLQPYVKSGEVEFAQPLPALVEQMLSFPRGRIDIPNALAYALLMRPGAPIYSDFDEEHIAPQPGFSRTEQLFVAAHATAAMTAAALVQLREGRFYVLADWVREGSPWELVDEIREEALLAADGLVREHAVRPASWQEMLKTVAPAPVYRRAPPVWVLPPIHREPYMNVGLAQAVRACPAEMRLGGVFEAGRRRMTELLRAREGGEPVVEIGPAARWTLRAFAGGYCRGIAKGGALTEEAESGPYRLLMEAIESFLGLGRPDIAEIAGQEQPVAYDRLGRAYKSAMPARRQ